MDGVIEGRIVHYVMPDGIAHRPAILTQYWPNSNGMSNMTVFTDILNDSRYGAEYGSGLVGKGSIHYSETKEVNTWHWPERN